MMLLSVLIPAYNEEKYLPSCLEAMWRQTLPRDRYEVIVVDNASTDATALVARRLGARVVEEPVRGIARARQAGFEVACGQVLASTDADTIVPPFWLERIAGHWARNPDLGAVCGPVYWTDGRPHEQFIMKHPVTWALALSNRAGRSWWMGCNFAVSAQVFRQVGGFSGYKAEGLLGEDVYLAGRVGQVAQILFDPRIAVHTSARRIRVGTFPYMQRAMANMVRVLILHQQPLPAQDVR